jgi:hypothetical protein
MERQQRRKKIAQPAPPELDPERSGPARPLPAHVRVVSGAFDESLEVAGMTVSSVSQMLAADPEGAGAAHALVDGRLVPGSHRLRAGETLELTPIVGEKGAFA